VVVLGGGCLFFGVGGGVDWGCFAWGGGDLWGFLWGFWWGGGGGFLVGVVGVVVGGGGGGGGCFLGFFWGGFWGGGVGVVFGGGISHGDHGAHCLLQAPPCAFGAPQESPFSPPKPFPVNFD